VSKGFVHSGGPTEDALFDWLAGRLRPQAAQWIADHVDGCKRCSAAVAQVRAVREALEPPEPGPFQRQSDIAAVRRRLQKPAHRLPRFAWVSSLALAALALVAWLGVKRGIIHVDFNRPVQVASTKPSVAPAPRPTGAELSWAILQRSGGADVELGDDHTTAQANQVLPSSGALSVQPGARVVARWGGARVLVDGGRTGARLRLVAAAPTPAPSSSSAAGCCSTWIRWLPARRSRWSPTTRRSPCTAPCSWSTPRRRVRGSR
jgi:hypothetical protein